MRPPPARPAGELDGDTRVEMQVETVEPGRYPEGAEPDSDEARRELP
jgi:hypothetical protein